MGNNNSINNRLGSALTPFIDYAIVKDALSVPLQAKNFGQFEANLINAVSPDLAAYDSSYGHNFVGKVPTKRKMQDCSTYAKPTIMRRYVYRLKMKLKDKDVPYFLSAQYLKNVLKDEFPNMSYFFRVAQVRDDQQYNRICTLEYLLQEYGAKVTSKTTMR